MLKSPPEKTWWNEVCQETWWNEVCQGELLQKVKTTAFEISLDHVFRRKNSIVYGDIYLSQAAICSQISDFTNRHLILLETFN